MCVAKRKGRGEKRREPGGNVGHGVLGEEGPDQLRDLYKNYTATGLCRFFQLILFSVGVLRNVIQFGPCFSFRLFNARDGWLTSWFNVRPVAVLTNPWHAGRMGFTAENLERCLLNNGVRTRGRNGSAGVTALLVSTAFGGRGWFWLSNEPRGRGCKSSLCWVIMKCSAIVDWCVDRVACSLIPTR